VTAQVAMFDYVKQKNCIQTSKTLHGTFREDLTFKTMAQTEHDLNLK
jgi:hypothetical protein